MVCVELFGHFFNFLAGALEPASGRFTGSLQATSCGVCGPAYAPLGCTDGALDTAAGCAHRTLNAASGGLSCALDASASCLAGMIGALLDSGQRLASRQRHEHGEYGANEDKVLHERLQWRQ
jgi:hypothetical protein